MKSNFLVTKLTWLVHKSLLCGTCLMYNYKINNLRDAIYSEGLYHENIAKDWQPLVENTGWWKWNRCIHTIALHYHEPPV